MKSLKDLNLPFYFDGESGCLVKDVYLPALSIAKRYDRAVGYFSTYALVEAAQGLSGLVRNQGKLRLIIGKELDTEAYEYVREGNSLTGIYSQLSHQLEELLTETKSRLAESRLELLSWLVGTKSLEMKIAFRKKGMFHQKIGIIEDFYGNKLAFQGSANESRAALLPDLNDEYTSIYLGWDPAVFDKYGAPLVNKFNSLWRNTSRGNIVVDIPSEMYEQLAHYRSHDTAPDSRSELSLINEEAAEYQNKKYPIAPKEIEGQPFSLREHQKAALAAWKENAFSGILEHATGSGKTITALWGALKIYEARKKVILIVGVPYQALANQWMDELDRFSFSPIACYVSKSKWEPRLRRDINDFNSGINDVIACVVVNRTLTSKVFQEIIRDINPTIWSKAAVFIGDECHHYGAEGSESQLPDTPMKLGLSATPFGADPTANAQVRKVFGDIVSRYSLDAALSDGVLTPYEYIPNIVYLDEEEEHDYLRLSSIIASLESQKEAGAKVDNSQLQHAYIRRAAVLSSCRSKLACLKRILDKEGPTYFTLAYSGSGYVEESDSNGSSSVRQLNNLTTLFSDAGWRIAPFSAEESKVERRDILNSFRFQGVHALASIKVLDEGIDIPGCATAFLVASSRSSRQFVQRRGRVLRKAPHKEYSRIFDFITLPINGHKTSLINLVTSELQRMQEFNRLARNKKMNAPSLISISNKWDIDAADIELPATEFSDE